MLIPPYQKYLTQMCKTISLDDVVQYSNLAYGTKIKHADALVRVLNELYDGVAFGVAEPITTIPKGGSQPINTVNLTRTQASIVTLLLCGRFARTIIARINSIPRSFIINGNRKERGPSLTALMCEAYATYRLQGILPVLQIEIAIPELPIDPTFAFEFAEGIATNLYGENVANAALQPKAI